MKKPISFTLLSLTCVAAAWGDSAPPPDPVAESFARMLNHTPVETAPLPAAAVQDNDPLRAGVNAVLWASQTPSFHLPPRADATPPAPRGH